MLFQQCQFIYKMFLSNSFIYLYTILKYIQEKSHHNIKVPRLRKNSTQYLGND